VDFIFNNRKLEELYTLERGLENYPEAVIEAFFEIMNMIENAPDERTFYALKNLHFEKLTRKRGKAEQRSLRLNQQWRLIIQLEKDQRGKFIVVIEIVDYH
jgi:proteic killer suppression protein